VTVSFESRHTAGRTTLHYGVAVRAEVPVELMAGFSEGSAYGGVRWVGRGPRGGISFAAEDDGGATWSVAIEVPLGGGEGE
jgi:hypothetical protein